MSVGIPDLSRGELGVQRNLGWRSSKGMLVTQTDAIRVDALEYNMSDWEEESYQLFVERADPQPCPRCGTTGFYGPRAVDPGIKYRACRFCGFWQSVDGEPEQCRPTSHGCEEWPECARAPYIWWVRQDTKRYTCPFCRQEVNVVSHNSFMKGVLILSPLENLDHPWRKVPQNRTYSYYLRFWENWACTKGRVIL